MRWWSEVLFLVRLTPEVHPRQFLEGTEASAIISGRIVMRIRWTAVAVLLFGVAAWAGSTGDVIGTWEGESKCAVPDSPCRDEHVVYRIATDKNDKTKLAIDADKIVNGAAVFMGTIECSYRVNRSALSCTANTPKRDDWEFQVSGDTMTGTLTVGDEKALYRRILVHRMHPNQN
jgi:hypothetical protein